MSRLFTLLTLYYLTFRYLSSEQHTLAVQKSIYTPQQRQFLALLRQVRVEAGLTQTELSERLEVPQSRISDYERGNRRMYLLELYQYCRALGIPLTDFVRRVEEIVSQGLP